VWELICTKGRRARRSEPGPGRAGGDPGGGDRRRRHRARLAGHFHLDYGDGELRRRLEIRGRIVELVRRLKPQVVICPDRRRCSSATVLQPLRPRVTGWADPRRRRPGAGNPHYSPSSWPPGSPPTTCRPCTCRAPWSPTAGSTSADAIETKIRRPLLPREPADRNGGVVPASSSGKRAEEGGRAANVRYAEGFRRLNLRRLTAFPVPNPRLSRVWNRRTGFQLRRIPPAFHSAIERSRRTATMATPPAATRPAEEGTDAGGPCCSRRCSRSPPGRSDRRPRQAATTTARKAPDQRPRLAPYGWAPRSSVGSGCSTNRS